MRLYKLWLEIEELDVDTGEYRNLTEEGAAEPVPVAVFSSLGQAQAYAESFAMDGGRAVRPWLPLEPLVN